MHVIRIRLIRGQQVDCDWGTAIRRGKKRVRRAHRLHMPTLHVHGRAAAAAAAREVGVKHAKRESTQAPGKAVQNTLDLAVG